MCDCDRALELLSARLDGQLTPEETAELEGHLAQCAPCTAIAFDLEAMSGLLTQLPEEVPQGFHSRLMERIGAEKVVSFPKEQKRALRSLLATAAVFTVVILGGGTLLRMGGGAPGSAAPPAGAPMAQAGVPAAMDAAPQDADYGPVEAAEDQARGGETEALQSKESGGTESSEPQATAQAPEPRIIFTEAPPADTVTGEEAAQAVAEVRWPGAETSAVPDESGAFSALRIHRTEGTLVLRYLGISADGAHYEFSLTAEEGGEELDRIAAPMDGGEVAAHPPSDDPGE